MFFGLGKKLTSAGGVLELLKKPLPAVIKATHLSVEELLLQKIFLFCTLMLYRDFGAVSYA